MKTLFLFFLVLVVSVRLPAQDEPQVPALMDTCLQSPTVRKRVSLSMQVNPFYLRGDFDGDSRPDYAIAVKGLKSGKMRVLVCTAAKGTFVLGREESGQAFSSMPADNFFAPNWMVYTRAEVRELTSYTSNVPAPILGLRGEAIAMVWEDGISMIHWDGQRFRWAGSRQ
jgi:hypothetical protein